MSASLGYMLLLSELLAAYVGGPVLHEGSFQVRMQTIPHGALHKGAYAKPSSQCSA